MIKIEAIKLQLNWINFIGEYKWYIAIILVVIVLTSNATGSQVRSE